MLVQSRFHLLRPRQLYERPQVEAKYQFGREQTEHMFKGRTRTSQVLQQ